VRSLEDTPTTKGFKPLNLHQIEKLLSECTEKDRNMVMAQFHYMHETAKTDRHVIDVLSRRLLSVEVAK